MTSARRRAEHHLSAQPELPPLWTITTSDSTITEGGTADWTISLDRVSHAPEVCTVEIREMTALEMGVAGGALALTDFDMANTLLEDCVASGIIDGHTTAVILSSGRVQLTFDASWDGSFLLNRSSIINLVHTVMSTGVLIAAASIGDISVASVAVSMADATTDSAPVNTSLPQIIGTGTVGSDHHFSDGVWSGAPTMTFPVRKLYRSTGVGSVVTPVTATFLGSSVKTVDATNFTHTTGYTLPTGRVAIYVVGRSAAALPQPTMTVAGITAAVQRSTINADAFGATRGSWFVVDLSSPANNNVFVDFAGVTVVRCGIEVYELHDSATLAAFATGAGVNVGSGSGLSATCNTPDDGILLAGAMMTNVGGNNRMASAAAATTAQTAVAVAAANGTTGITWTGVTESAASDVVLEAGSNGNGVLVLASWAPTAGGGSPVNTEITVGVDLVPPGSYVPTLTDLAAGFLFTHIEANDGVGGNVAAESAYLTVLPEVTSGLPAVTPNFRVYDFLDMLGINTQLNRTDLAYSYYGTSSYARIVANMAYLGSPHVRSIAQDAGPFDPAAWNYLASHSLKLCLHHNPQSNYAGLKSGLNKTLALATTYPGSIFIVEGANEQNNFSGWPSYTDRSGVFHTGGSANPAASSRQDDMFYAVHSEPAYAVLHNSGAKVARFTTGGGSPAVYPFGACDWHNGHNYPGLATPQNWPIGLYADSSPLPTRIRNGIIDHNSETPQDQIITECGGYTDFGGGVDQTTQARLILNYWYIAAETGHIKHIYPYEMYDENSRFTSSEGHFGLWNRPIAPPGGNTDVDSVPKPAAVAIHNQNTLIVDVGATKASFTLSTTHYQLNGLPATAHHLTLQKSNGDVWVIVWDERPYWNFVAPVGPVTVTPVPVSISVPAGKTATWYAPMTSTSAVASPTLGANPLLVKIA